VRPKGPPIHLPRRRGGLDDGPPCAQWERLHGEPPAHSFLSRLSNKIFWRHAFRQLSARAAADVRIEKSCRGLPKSVPVPGEQSAPRPGHDARSTGGDTSMPSSFSPPKDPPHVHQVLFTSGLAPRYERGFSGPFLVRPYVALSVLSDGGSNLRRPDSRRCSRNQLVATWKP